MYQASGSRKARRHRIKGRKLKVALQRVKVLKEDLEEGEENHRDTTLKV